MSQNNARTFKVRTMITLLGVISLSLLVFYFGYGLTPAGQAFMHNPMRFYYFLTGGILDFVTASLNATVNPIRDIVVPIFNSAAGLVGNIFSFIPHLSLAVPFIFTVTAFISLGASISSLAEAVRSENSAMPGSPEKHYWHQKKKDAAVTVTANALISAGIIGFSLLGIAGPVFPAILAVGFACLLIHSIYRARNPLAKPAESIPMLTENIEIEAGEKPSLLSTPRMMKKLISPKAGDYETLREEDTEEETLSTNPPVGSPKGENPDKLSLSPLTHPFFSTTSEEVRDEDELRPLSPRPLSPMLNG